MLRTFFFLRHFATFWLYSTIRPKLLLLIYTSTFPQSFIQFFSNNTHTHTHTHSYSILLDNDPTMKFSLQKAHYLLEHPQDKIVTIGTITQVIGFIDFEPIILIQNIYHYGVSSIRKIEQDAIDYAHNLHYQFNTIWLVLNIHVH